MCVWVVIALESNITNNESEENTSENKNTNTNYYYVNV